MKKIIYILILLFFCSCAVQKQKPYYKHKSEMAGMTNAEKNDYMKKNNRDNTRKQNKQGLIKA